MLLVRLLAVVALGTGVAAQTAAPANPGSDKPSRQSSNSAAEAEKERSGADPLLDLPPLPEKPATLVGGTVTTLDRVRDRMVVRAFGGGEMELAFDTRTKFNANGAPADPRDIRPGSRVYVDTIFDGKRIFARNVTLAAGPGQGDVRGQIEAYDSRRGIITVRDSVSPLAVKLKVMPQTSVSLHDRSGNLGDIREGALVVVNFSPGGDAVSTARRIRILASPGQVFTFAGTITFVDLRARRFAVNNRADNQTYDIALDSAPTTLTRSLRWGADTVVTAVFDGKHYQARSIETAPSGNQRSSNSD